jgi:hypothetical protein
MASVIEKRRTDGRVYYYLVESARVDGKPRIVSQQYLGSAAEVAAKLTGTPAGAPVRSQHKAFGDLAAVWGMLERLGVAEVIDAVVPRRADAGATAGTYLALACANRVVAPCSKLGFADWWAATAGPRWVKVPAAALDHRRFWEAMNLLDEGDLAAIEAELGRRIVTEFDLDLSGLILDMTNFATYIDSGNDKAPIAQRGKAKQKRVDLRLVGLGLIVTRDGSVPLLSHAYPGDRPDVTQFPHLLEELLAATGSSPTMSPTSPSSTTPGKTRPPTIGKSRHPGSDSSARSLPVTTLTSWRYPAPATAKSMPERFPVSPSSTPRSPHSG